VIDKSALIVLNPHAGRGRARKLADQLPARARALGWDVELRATTHAGHEVDLGAAAAAEKWPVVVAVGGDGTVHGVANGLLQDGSSETALTHVPVGTGNDFASTVGLSKAHHPERNLALVLQGTSRRLDVGCVLGEYFLNSCGVGFGPEVVRRTAEFPRLRGFPLYLAAVVRAFFAFGPATLTITADEHTEEGGLLMLEASLGETVGGGFRLTSDDIRPGGLFDVCVIREINRLRFLRYLISGLRGTLARLDAVTVFRTRRFEVATPSLPLAVHLDGELRASEEPKLTVELFRAHLPALVVSSDS
jgi:YegS/Rv2252/BmrU family lipid kinase